MTIQQAREILSQRYRHPYYISLHVYVGSVEVGIGGDKKEEMHPELVSYSIGSTGAKQNFYGNGNNLAKAVEDFLDKIPQNPDEALGVSCQNQSQ